MLPQMHVVEEDGETIAFSKKLVMNSALANYTGLLLVHRNVMLLGSKVQWDVVNFNLH
jgi:hypothetical protein